MDLNHEDEMDPDLLLALKLQQEEEAAAAAAAGNKAGNPPPGSLYEELMRQQEEADMKMAMELQNSLYQQGFKPPPQAIPSSFGFGGGIQPPVAEDEGDDAGENSKLKYTLSNWQNLHPDLERNRPAPTPEAVKRILADYQELIKAKNPLIHVTIDEDDVTHVSALIIGPEDTPYADGFFHFDMVYPHDYPWNPPKVTLVTTNNGTVRFNPNLYSNGKVCLSILGTWSGPSWTSVQTMYSTLISIQSLMNGAPYHNEPGYEDEKNTGDVEAYNKVIQHETLRVAVCGMMERPTCEGLFQEEMQEHFLANFDKYVALAEKLSPELDGKSMRDPFREPRGKYNYKTILNRLHAIKKKLTEVTASSSVAAAAAAAPVQPVDDKMDVDTHASPQVNQPPPDDMSVDEPSLETPKKKVKFNEDGESAQGAESTPAAQTPSINSTASLAPVAFPAMAPPVSPIPPPASAAKTPISADFLSSILQNVSAPLAPSSPASIASPSGNVVLEAGNNMIALDAQLAAMLQAEFNAQAPKPHHQHHQHRNNNPSSTGASPAGGRVKPPKLDELLKSAESSGAKEPDVVCIVCKQAPMEYIALPNCGQPHTYCMACANKMVKSVNSYNNELRYLPPNLSRALNKEKDRKIITCVLCKSVNFVDSQSGVAPLRRIAKRKRADDKPVDQCPEHNDFAILFCTEYNQMCCPTCLMSEHHRKHTDAMHLAFDDAADFVKKRLTSQLDALRQKRGEHRDFERRLREQRQDLTTAAEAAKTQLKEKIEGMKRLLDNKLEEMEGQIRTVQASRENKIDAELGKTDRRMQAFEQSLDLIEKFQSMGDPMSLLAQMEDADDQLRTATMAPVPKADAKWFKMPAVHVKFVEDAIKHLKYRESAMSVAHPSAAALAELGLPAELFEGEDYDAGEGEEGEEGMDSDEEPIPEAW